MIVGRLLHTAVPLLVLAALASFAAAMVGALSPVPAVVSLLSAGACAYIAELIHPTRP